MIAPRRFAVAVVLFVSLAAAADEPGQLTIVAGSIMGGAAGKSMNFSWQGTPLPLPPNCTAMATRWQLSGPNGYSQTATGDSASFSFGPGGHYYISVDLPYVCSCIACASAETCQIHPEITCGGSRGGGYVGQYPVFEAPTIVDIETYPTPVLVDVPMSPIAVTGDFPAILNDADITWGDGDSCTSCFLEEHTYDFPGQYQLKIVGRNPAGTSTRTETITVHPDPPTVVWGFADLNARRAGDPVRFTSTIGGGVPNRTLLWDFGDGTTSTEEDPTHVFAAADDYLVSLSVTNRWGTVTESSWVTIDPRTGGSPPPTPSFVFSPQSPVTGQLVHFTDRSTGNIRRWRWNFDYQMNGSTLQDGPFSILQNPTFVFDTWGRRNVELKVSNEFGSRSIVLFIDVLRSDQPPLASFTWTPFAPVVNQQIQFTDTSFGATSWNWNFGDGATSTSQNPTHAYSTPGQKSVTLRVTNAHGTDQVTKFFPCEEAGDTLRANFTWSPSAPRPGQNVTFTDLSTGSPGGWSWTFSDGFTSNVRHPSHVFAAAGTYAITLRVTKGSATHETTQNVIVTSIGKPVASFSFSPSSPKVGQAVSFSDTSTNSASSWSWDFGDGGVSSQQNPSHTYTTEGTFTVTLTATNSDGSDSTSRTVLVVPAEPELAADFTASSLEVVAGTQISFTDASAGNPEQWSWSFGDGSTSTQRNPVHTYTKEGSKRVTLTVTRGTKTSTNSRDIGVFVRPIASFRTTGDLAANVPVTLTDTSSGPPKTREWVVEGKVIGNSPSVDHTFDAAGAAVVRLRVQNPAGADTLAREVVIAPRPMDAKPSINRIRNTLGPCVFERPFDVKPSFDLSTAWNALTADRISVTVDGGAPFSFAADGVLQNPEQLEVALDSRDFNFNESVKENRLLFKAVSKEGPASDGQEAKIYAFTLPWYFMTANSVRTIVEPKRTGFAAGLYIPARAIDKTVTFPSVLPFVGGWEIGVRKAQFKLDHIVRTDCSAYTNVEITGRLSFGKLFAGIKGTGTSDGKLSTTTGVAGATLLSLAIEGFGGGETEQKLLEVVPVLAAPCATRVLETPCGLAKVRTETMFSLGGSWEFTVPPDGTPEFKRFLTTVKGQTTITGRLELGPARLEVFGGGKIGVGLNDFRAPDVLQKFEMSVEFGGRMNFMAFNYEYKDGMGCTWDPVKRVQCGSTIKNKTAKAGTGLRVLPAMSRAEKVEATAEQPPVVLRNVSTLADPAGAARGAKSVLVYVSENETMASSAQRTDLRSVTAGASGTWSAPLAITRDQHGDFNPAVTVTPDGGVVAAWERLRDPSKTFSDVTGFEDLSKLMRETEIAVSVLAPAATAWPAATMLTANDLFDSSPALASLDDGTVLLVWLRAAADGTGPQQIVSRTFASGSWSSEQVLATGLQGVVNPRLAASSNRALLVFAHDRDGSSATSADRDLASFEYRNGAWLPKVDVTADAEEDSAPTVVYAGTEFHAFWNRAGKLVTRALPAGPIVLVDGEETTTSALGIQAAARSDGSIILTWPAGTTVYGRIRDTRGSWSEPVPIVERDGAPSELSVLSLGDTNLRLAGTETELHYSDVESVIDGRPVLIEGVASPGRVDLVEYVTPIHSDLAAVSFEPAPSDPVSGSEVKFAAQVKNGGLIAAHGVTVQLRDGERVAASSVIDSLQPGAQVDLELKAPYQSASPRFTLVVDPANVSQDADRSNNALVHAFDNRLPLACLQANVVKGAIPLQISFDSSCSRDSDGTITSRRWLFGDGDLANGSTATHTYEAAGPFTATLVIDDDTGGTSTASVEITPGASENWTVPHGSNSIYIPVVGRTAGGAGSFFVTDLSILNTDETASLDVDAVYMPDGRPEFHRRFTLQGGEIARFDDLLARLFGASDGVGSVRLDLSHPHATAIARLYNLQSSGTAGLSINSLTKQEAVREGESLVILQHWLPGYRTNLGFTEVDGRHSIVTATVHGPMGNVTGTVVQPLAPYAHAQLSSHPLLQSAGHVEITVSGGSVMPYLSTVDGTTGDPIYQEGTRRGPSAATVLLVPVAARLQGANQSTWRTDLRLFNAAAVAQPVTIEFQTGGVKHNVTRTLAPGETAAYDDVIAVLYPSIGGNPAGSLTLRAPGSIMASSRTFNLTSKGTYGLFVPARRAEDLVNAGQTAFLLHLDDNTAYRCNLGMTALDGAAVVRIRAVSSAGQTLGMKSYTIGSGENMQISRIFRDLGVTEDVNNASIEATVLQGKAFVYASVNDNGTGDGTFVEARK